MMQMHIDGPGEASRHKCLLYEGDPSEQLPVIVPLLMDGLKSRERCLYLGSPETVDMMGAALHAKGVDVRKEAARTALLMSSDRGHLKDGRFDPSAMVAMLRELIDKAVADGFTGLCATGDMMWELGTEKNFESLLEYEALLEKVFREKPLRGICQYRRDTVPADAFRDALLTHRSAYVGAELSRDNLFYVPPEILLEERDDSREKQGEWMCQQILRIMRAESQRDRALAELAQANRELESRVERRTAELQASNRELETFSYSVSHDLRAPLRAMDGFSRALEEDCAAALDAKGRDSLSRIRAAAKRMDELIDGMLGLSRVTRQELKSEPVDLSARAESAAAGLRLQAPGRAVEFVIAPGLGAPGDPALLGALLDNLLGNAWKFTAKRAQARVEFGAAEKDGELVFFVKDDGAGFEMSRAQDLFTPFRRLHAPEEFPGHGVGLATCRRIVARHGGRLWAESRPGAGAAFYFTLSSSARSTSE